MSIGELLNMEWVSKSEVMKRMKFFRNAIDDLNNGDFKIKVIARLVGSAKKNLVLTHDSNGSFDSDIDIIITWKEDGVRDEETRKIFYDFIKPYMFENGYNPGAYRTRTFAFVNKNEFDYTHSFDIMVQIEKSITHSVNYSNQKYTLGKVKESRDYTSKENIVKNEDLLEELRNTYKYNRENNVNKTESYIVYCNSLDKVTSHAI